MPPEHVRLPGPPQPRNSNLPGPAPISIFTSRLMPDLQAHTRWPTRGPCRWHPHDRRLPPNSAERKAPAGRLRALTLPRTLTLTLSLAAALALGGCRDTAPPASASTTAPATPVSVWVATPVRWTDGREWAGTLEPLRVHELRLPAAGRVRDIPVREGDAVAAGAILARIESPDLEARLPVLSERVDRLGEELSRWQALAAANAAGAGEVTAAELRLFEAQEALAALQATRGGLALRAPVDGQVVRVALTPGREEGAGALALVLEEAASYGLRLRIPASEAGRFQDPTALEVVGGPGLGEPLAIDRVVSSPDLQPGFVQVELYFENPLPVREAVRVRVLEEGEGMVLPWTAVAADGTRNWIAVAVPSSGEAEGDGAPVYRVERRTVELGRAHPEGVEARSGVAPGDYVIRYEPRSHREGRVVAPIIAAGSGGTRGEGGAP
jgi:multidrug efflux pump subunit AcrA (membrane-fusion protein)